ncbi:4-hydroxy-tetrahydrodipicolinate synthase [Dactylococcopsis salina]|uniref:4-hydroxy-tetrahydrodipicolinate synthase n=1 Tax=Dactylococcopsis salina (strain PCC 8305) TaxID=13035 RepID=K9YXW7_DACS8|nr:4-hydroxy-tetrahydrodipicolinate synthase [Dactylococcopsis salina]AFZ50958.1 dihydrodipicolinate synthase [Dactylococcopsis salina PCC 8305]
MTSVDFGQVLTAMVTPLTAEGAVNYPVVEQLADYLVSHGTETLVVCGTTGESPTLTWEEEYELFQVVQKAVGNRGKVMAGTGSNSTHEAIEATKKAAKLGVEGTLQVVPYYSKPPQEGLYQHFSAIAQSSPDLPMMLYNIPGRTGRNLEPTTVAKLAKLENIVAIKEASGDLDQVSTIRASTPPEFGIYSGDDSLTLPLLAVGGTGVVSVASHLVGLQLQQMITEFKSGKLAVAQEIHLKLFPLFRALFLSTNPIPVKTALRLQGWDVGALRSPLSELPPELETQLKDVLTKLSLL